MSATHDSIVKSDRRGRLRYAPEQKAALVKAYAASGLSGPRFVALNGVNCQSFASSHQKRKLAAAKAGLPAPQDLVLVEVAVLAVRGTAAGLRGVPSHRCRTPRRRFRRRPARRRPHPRTLPTMLSFFGSLKVFV